MNRIHKLTVCVWLVATAACWAIGEPLTGRFAVSPGRIADAMRATGIEVIPDQIELLSHGNSTTADARLQVVSISRGTTGASTTIAKLRCQDNRECLPFYVLLHGVDDRVKNGRLGVALASSIKPRNLHDLIRGGDRATLVLETPDARMSFPVICLQSGMRGQKIRVASVDHKRFYDAEIVTVDLLKGTL